MDKICAYPKCKNIAESRGQNSITGGNKRWKWCSYHRKGKGKVERLKLNQ